MQSKKISFGLAWTFVGFINLMFGGVWFACVMIGVSSVALLFQGFCLLFTFFAGSALALTSLLNRFRLGLPKLHRQQMGGMNRTELEAMWRRMDAQKTQGISAKPEHKEPEKPKDAYEEFLAVHQGGES